MVVNLEVVTAKSNFEYEFKEVILISFFSIPKGRKI